MSTIKWLPTATINNESGVTVVGTPGNGVAFYERLFNI